MDQPSRHQSVDPDDRSTLARGNSSAFWKRMQLLPVITLDWIWIAADLLPAWYGARLNANRARHTPTTPGMTGLPAFSLNSQLSTFNFFPHPPARDSERDL